MKKSPHRSNATNHSPAGKSDARLDLSRVRHELRTSLNHILGYCEVLQEDPNTPREFENDLQRIHAGGRQLLSLIAEHFDNERLALTKRNLHQLRHELRTPVNHIVGYAEMLIDEAVAQGNNQILPDLKRIAQAARQWLALMEKHLRRRSLEYPTPPRSAASFHPDETGDRLRPGKESLSGRVLVVDDDTVNRQILARRLRRQGLTVSLAANGADALAKATSGQFDLILLDMLMPGMDGDEVLARLKAGPVLAEIPVIMISALDQDDRIARCVEMGAEDYIAKPFNPVFLRARIKACLEQKRLRERETSFLRRIQEEKQRTDELLYVILPRDVAAELRTTQTVRPRRFDQVAVLFSDIVGFASYSDVHAPEQIVAHLQTLVQMFEDVAERHGLEKIKTIGDAFMAVAGMRSPSSDPTTDAVRCGLEMIDAARSHSAGWQIRVGVHTGPVVAGIVGRKKYQYDVWGDTVNMAARVEQAGQPDAVCVTAATWAKLAPRFLGQSKGRVPIKGKGELELFLVTGLRQA